MPSLEQIDALLEGDPDDVFLNYCRAIELAKADRIDEAAAGFDRVLALDADYCAAHFHKGQTLLNAGRRDEARAALEAGRQAADAVGDLKTRDEITDLLTAIG